MTFFYKCYPGLCVYSRLASLSLLRKGFAVSSALGKLRLFRAVREDKAVSLLHIAILAAAGAEALSMDTSF